MHHAPYLCLCLLLCLLLPAPTTASCNLRGIYNSATRSCACTVGYTGLACEFKVCPFGFDWISPPTAHNQGHGLTECSGIGDCDKTTGKCLCKIGFKGAACDQMECPLGATNSTGEVTKTCSGHGRCMNLEELSYMWMGTDNMEFGGLMVNPGTTDMNRHYTSNLGWWSWDARQIQGCVCDPPYAGFNCTNIACPRGDDFSQPLDKYGLKTHNEVMKIECGATMGTFRFSFRGETTGEIPYNAPYGRVKAIIEKLNGIGDATLTMTQPTVCGMAGNVATVTTLEFVDQSGPMPPAKVTAQSNLLNVAAKPILNMITQYVVKCPQMNLQDFVADPRGNAPDQGHGGIQFMFDGQLSRVVNYTDSVSEVESALKNMTAFRHDSDFGHVNVTVDMTAQTNGGLMCSQTAVINTTIEFRSDYGNLYELDIVDLMEFNNQKSNFTLISPRATTKSMVCSNRGTCNHKTGQCQCFFDTGDKQTQIRKMQSSNGQGLTGSHGDCGFLSIPQTMCAGGLLDPDDPLTFKPCFDNGFCDNSTYTCRCSGGFEGADCSMRTCPKGRAWFDMPKGSGYAHQTELTCSGKGACDEVNGLCLCQVGFGGEACDKLECGDANNEGCGTRGRCLTMSQLGDVNYENGEWTKYRYGDSDPHWNGPGTWDRDMIQGCSCDGGEVEINFNGPSGQYVSGILVDSPMALGFEGYACHKAMCPHGDDPDTPGVNEIQNVTCSLTTGTFTLTFREQVTSAIAYNAVALTVQTALQALSTVSAVTVALNSGSATVCGAGPLGFTVEFTGEPGNVPNMKVSSGSLVVYEAVQGTKEYVPCSNRGTCVTKTGALQGTCECLPGYASSNGNGAKGTKRDCGYYDPYWLPASLAT